MNYEKMWYELKEYLNEDRSNLEAKRASLKNPADIIENNAFLIKNHQVKMKMTNLTFEESKNE